MGAAGVGLAALGAHRSGRADLTTAAHFLLFHAAAVLGTLIFSFDLTLIGRADAWPLPAAAAVGGLGMIGGWFLVVVAAVLSETRQR